MLTTISRAFVLVVAGIVFGFILRAHTISKSSGRCIAKTCFGHFTGSREADCAVLIEPVKGLTDSNYIALFRQQGTHRTLLWKSPPAPVWDIFLADIDGDGYDELAVCFFKSEPHDPKKDNRLQIFSWKNDAIHARWRGTFLSKPFERIAFGDVTGDGAEELISIERGRRNPGRVFLCVYCWNGFGFDLLTETEIESIPDNVSAAPDTHAEIALKFHNSTVHYLLSDKTLTIGGR